MMQSIIIFALAFYFFGANKTWSSNKTSAAFIALSLVALTVHPYFLPFVSGLFVAFMVDQIVKGESWLPQLKRLLTFGYCFGSHDVGSGVLRPQSTTWQVLGTSFSWI